MGKSPRSLFDLVVEEVKANESFKFMKTHPGHAPHRWMLDKVFSTFDDADGNFVEQFQTTGFDARFFELYLHAYFSRGDFVMSRPRPNPDFVVCRGDFMVAVEATTVNPATSGAASAQPHNVSNMTPDSIRHYQRNELAIRFGSPLFSKLQKKYWTLPTCKDMPVVLAIEAFHDVQSLFFSDAALTSYLYGLEQSGSWSRSGNLELTNEKLEKHEMGEKTIPSGFFDQPHAEHISAILFSNSGTAAKFGRMGYLHGQSNDSLVVMRQGTCYTPDPDAMDPTSFRYDLDKSPVVETWGQGLVVAHNPKALRPIPNGFFTDAAEHRIEKGMVVTTISGWHPMASQTMFMNIGPNKSELQKIPYRPHNWAITSISKQSFQRIIGINHDENPIFEENGWYIDDADGFLGVVLRDKVDADWGYVILARDPRCRFRAIKTAESIASRDEARRKLHEQIADLLESPRRYFEQGDEQNERG